MVHAEHLLSFWELGTLVRTEDGKAEDDYATGSQQALGTEPLMNFPGR